MYSYARTDVCLIVYVCVYRCVYMYLCTYCYVYVYVHVCTCMYGICIMCIYLWADLVRRQRGGHSVGGRFRVEVE